MAPRRDDLAAAVAARQNGPRDDQSRSTERNGDRTNGPNNEVRLESPKRPNPTKEKGELHHAIIFCHHDKDS